MLPNKLLMLDCEFSDLDPKEGDLLQLAALKMNWNEEKEAYTVSDYFNKFIHSDKEPDNPWHKEHLTEVYRKANASTDTVEAMKETFKHWVGADNDAWPCGDCVHTDVEYMFHKELIDRNTGEEDGTLNFRIFDLKPIKQLARHLGTPKVEDVFSPAHDALVDCLNQAHELNEYLKALMGSEVNKVWLNKEMISRMVDSGDIVG